jgi:hypothetical protein
MSALTAANLPLRVVLELAALAALAVWGANATSSSTINIALAVGAPVAAAAIWGVWSAPRAARRLRGHALTLLELALLAVSAVALAAAGYPILACILVVVAVLNGVALSRFSQGLRVSSSSRHRSGSRSPRD